MIKMLEVIELLTDCELSNMIYVDSENQKLNMDHIPKLVRSINLGVLELHKRFNLKIGTLTVVLDKSRHRYALLPKYQTGNKPDGPDDVKYIKQGDDKISAQSILKLERIFDDKGHELKLNEVGDYESLTTPNDTTIQVSDWFLQKYPTENLRVEYRMAPKKVLMCEDFTDDWDCLDVDIPYSHLQALVYFVAMRSHSSTGFQANTASEFNNYAQKYEIECTNLDVLNLRVDPQGRNDRLVRGGWA